MLPVFGITIATLGLLLIVALIFREVGDQTASTEKGMLGAASALVLVVGIWQVIAHLPSGGAGH